MMDGGKQSILYKIYVDVFRETMVFLLLICHRNCELDILPIESPSRKNEEHHDPDEEHT